MIQACRENRTIAFNIVTWFWLLGGIILLLLKYTVENDERVVQMKVRQALLNSHQYTTLTSNISDNPNPHTSYNHIHIHNNIHITTSVNNNSSDNANANNTTTTTTISY